MISELSESTLIFKWYPDVADFTSDHYTACMHKLIFGLGNDTDMYFPLDATECERTYDLPGDTFFLLRLGQGPCGIIARGSVNSIAIEKPDRTGPGGKAMCVELYPSVMLPEDKCLMLGIDKLEQAIPEVDWRSPAPGISLNEDQAERLKALWRNHMLENWDDLGMRRDRDTFVELISEETVYEDPDIKIELRLRLPEITLYEYEQIDDEQQVFSCRERSVSILFPTDAQETLGLDSLRGLYSYIRGIYSSPDGIDRLAADLLERDISFTFTCEKF